LNITSSDFDLDRKDKLIHITNYSLQKLNENFSKYETDNEVSFEDFQSYLNEVYKGKVDIKRDFYPQMREIIKMTTLSIKNKINKKQRQFCYVILGYDFLIDSNFKIWLIEVNKNPGLFYETSKIYNELSPRLIDDALKLTVDEIFKPDLEEKTSPYHVKGYSDSENMWEYLNSLK
jgi:hypothetical protein